MEKKAFLNISLPALILGVSIIISAIVGASTWYKIRSLDNTLSVTGSAKESITSDQAKLITSISRRVTADTLSAGYAQLNRDLEAAKVFYAKNGIDVNALTISPVSTNEVWKQNDTGIKEYDLRQTIELHSTEVDKITALSKKITDLSSQGVFVSIQSLEYSYSKLSDLRVKLLSSALEDAKARAKSIAQTSGKGVGALKSASSGVVQVLSPGSTEVSDYGSYDTASIQKDVMVTVKATFIIQ